MASMCRAMENNGSYDFSAAFARLTCLFEDGAEVASRGQAARLSWLRRTELAGQLASFNQEVGEAIQELRDALPK